MSEINVKTDTMAVIIRWIMLASIIRQETSFVNDYPEVIFFSRFFQESQLIAPFHIYTRIRM